MDPGPARAGGQKRAAPLGAVELVWPGAHAGTARACRGCSRVVVGTRGLFLQHAAAKQCLFRFAGLELRAELELVLARLLGRVLSIDSAAIT